MIRIRQLRNSTGCCIKASMRVPPLQERLITLVGTYDALVRASLELLRIIQEDPHLQEHLYVSYEDIKLPLGFWTGTGPQVADESLPLMHQSTLEQNSKHQLVGILRELAQPEFPRG